MSFLLGQWPPPLSGKSCLCHNSRETIVTLWHPLMHRCPPPQFNSFLHGIPQDISDRWHGMLRLLCKSINKPSLCNLGFNIMCKPICLETDPSWDLQGECLHIEDIQTFPCYVSITFFLNFTIGLIFLNKHNHMESESFINTEWLQL